MSEEKMQKDCSAIVDAQLPEIQATAKGNVTEALEKLLALEKQTRVAADLASNSRVLLAALQISLESGDWKLLNENIIMLSKRHGLLKQAVTKMIQEAMTYIDKTPDMATKLELIDTLRTVTDGKIFVEVERARLTRTLAEIKEKEGKTVEAADILQDLQVETFGSMDKREKTDFILEQMRLVLAKKDYTRVQIISKKISPKFFKDVAYDDLKYRYYQLMVQYSVHEGQYLDVCRHYRQIYDTATVKEDTAKQAEILRMIMFFVILAPYDNEQSDLIHRVAEDPNLMAIEQFRDFIKCFIINELMRWPKMEQIYGGLWKDNYVFDTKTEDGQKRYKDLHKRVIEHNIRVVAMYYDRITVKRLTQLLDLSPPESEEFLSNLVVKKTIWARIDRPAGVVEFHKKRDANSTLNEWSTNITSLLDLIVKTTHLITKEEMVASSGITQVI
ncbi:26S proteasome non-ATPase regulatory subunit 12 [Geranomyces variabilis]|nr:26S proteasome non-ATPase regulatory subunit 12 [Geranomyces variabilis]